MEMQIICVQGKGHFLFFPGIEGDTGKGFQFKTRSGDFALFPETQSWAISVPLTEPEFH